MIEEIGDSIFINLPDEFYGKILFKRTLRILGIQVLIILKYVVQTQL